MDDDAHGRIEDLLPRYATLQRDDKDPAVMYPEVTRHLEQCPECQDLLESLLAPVDLPDARTLKPTDIPFFQHQAPPPPPPVHQPISLPEVEAPAPDVMRGFSAIQSGGRLLMQEMFTIGEQTVTLILTLHQSSTTDFFTINGEIYADARCPDLQAYLEVDGVKHVANTKDGGLTFQKVKIDQSNSQIDLTLELLD